MSIIYESMHGSFSWHKVDIRSLLNQWFLNFNYVLLIIKLAEGLEGLMNLGDTSTHATHIFEKKVEIN